MSTLAATTATTATAGDAANRARPRALANLLFAVACMVFAMVVIGACVSTYMWWYLPTLKLPSASAKPAEPIVSRTELP